MDNQKVTVFRQKNKAGLTAAAIAGCLAVSPMLGAGVFLPQVLTTVPVLLLAPELTAFFNQKPEVVSYGALLLRLVLCVGKALAYAFVLPPLLTQLRKREKKA